MDVIHLINVPRVMVISAGLYDTKVNGSRIKISKLYVVEPPVLFAQMVKEVRLILTNGVPEIIPLLKFKPVGKAGEICHVAALPPETFGYNVIIDTSRVSSTNETE